MAHEARKGLIRIISNYLRLLTTLCLGIALVPLLISWLGDQSFGLISLLGANIGLAAIFRQIIQQSLVRELGAAYHAGGEVFESHYRAICFISVICAALSIVTFAAMILLLPFLDIPPDMVGASRIFVAAQGINTAVMITLSPMLNMYLVTERFIGYNVWFIGLRTASIISALVLGYIVGIKDTAVALQWYGIMMAAVSILVYIIAAAYIYTKDRRLMIRCLGVSRDALRSVFGTFSWNSVVQVAMNLHEQIPPLLLNIFVGPLANAAWGIGFRFVSYIRMATTGVQFGSDAVSARLAAHDDSDKAKKQLQQLIGIQTKLTAMVALPAAFGVLIYCWPIFHIWVGRTLKNYEFVMTTAVLMTRVLVWALAARSISETWMIVLYGAGYVRSYAKWVVIGGIIAPGVSTLLMFLLPDDLRPFAPPAMLAIVFVFVHLFGFPFIVGKCLDVNPISMLRSLLRPLFATLSAACAGIAVLAVSGNLMALGLSVDINAETGASIEWAWVLASIVAYGIVYAIATGSFVLTANERSRIVGTIRARMPGSTAPGASPE